jgi:hypothetical protein
VDETYSYCSMPPVAPREFPAGTDPARVEAIVVNESKWVNQPVLHYHFFDRETDGEHVFLADGTRQWRPWTTDKTHQDVVRNTFDHWNILRKIEPDTVQGSNWDPDSIMHYPSRAASTSCGSASTSARARARRLS